jgi:hypothetical protein
MKFNKNVMRGNLSQKKKKAGIVNNKKTTTQSDHIKQVINENIEKQACQN